MNWFKKVWDWFNGKKLVIGATCIGVSMYLIDGLLWKQWHIGWPGLVYINDFLVWAGGLLTGGGLIHKAVKSYEAKANSVTP